MTDILLLAPPTVGKHLERRDTVGKKEKYQFYFMHIGGMGDAGTLASLCSKS